LGRNVPSKRHATRSAMSKQSLNDGRPNSKGNDRRLPGPSLESCLETSSRPKAGENVCHFPLRRNPIFGRQQRQLHGFGNSVSRGRNVGQAAASSKVTDLAPKLMLSKFFPGTTLANGIEHFARRNTHDTASPTIRIRQTSLRRLGTSSILSSTFKNPTPGP